MHDTLAIPARLKFSCGNKNSWRYARPKQLRAINVPTANLGSRSRVSKTRYTLARPIPSCLGNFKTFDLHRAHGGLTWKRAAMVTEIREILVHDRLVSVAFSYPAGAS
jgi:hypothetical protein